MKATMYQKSYTDIADIEEEVEVEDKCVARWDEGWTCGGEIVWERDYGTCKACNVTYVKEKQ